MKFDEIEVNKGVCAIIPIDDNHCKIINDKDIKTSMSAIKVIEQGCRFYGSSFEGRVEGSKFLLGPCYKLQIIIEEITETILFPTHSYKHKKCSWISFSQIKEYIKIGYNVKVTFNNNKTLILPISFESFEMQIFRATKLLLTLKKRKEKNGQ